MPTAQIGRAHVRVDRGGCGERFSPVKGQVRTQTEVGDLERARARFLAKVRIEGEHWIWTASTSSSGRHGWFRFAGRFNAIPTHRAAWLLWRGDLPGPGRVVAACRERALCVRPEHLEDADETAHSLRSLLSAAAMQDHRGELSPMAKLSNAQARAVVDLHETFGWTYARLAEHFRVSKPAIQKLVTGQTWGSVTGRAHGAGR